MNSGQHARGEAFLAMHDGPAFVLPNVWDVASARIFIKSGARCLGTTSAGIAASLGFGDGEEITRDAMLEGIARISAAVEVPVTADIEGGYGDDPGAVAETTRLAIDAGAIGVNIEDTARGRDGRPAVEPLLSMQLHCERIAAAREAGEQLGLHVVINAVIYTHLRRPEGEIRFAEAVDRARAYREAGADCVYVPGMRDRDEIASFVERVECPVNVLAARGVASVADLSKIGVRRVSIGFAASRATISLLGRIADELLTHGTYEALLDGSLSNDEAEALVRAG